jgi:hypothetical protein
MKHAQSRLIVPGILFACVVMGAALTLSQSQSPKVRLRHLIALVEQGASGEVSFGKARTRVQYRLADEDIVSLAAWLRSSIIDVDPLPWEIHGGMCVRKPGQTTVIIILSGENRACIFEEDDGWNSRIYLTGPTPVPQLLAGFKGTTVKPR